MCYGHVAGGPRGFACTTEVTWLALEWGTHMPSLGRGSLPSEGPQGPLRCHRVLGAFRESLCYTMCLDPCPFLTWGLWLNETSSWRPSRPLRKGSPH